MKQDLSKAESLLGVFSKMNVQPQQVGMWQRAIKNIMIQAMVSMPPAKANPTDVQILQEDLQTAKDAADFLDHLQTALES